MEKVSLASKREMYIRAESDSNRVKKTVAAY